MKPNVPELLLVLYIFLPLNNALMASVILCQIQAIHTTRRAENELDLELGNDTDKALRDFLVAFWFNPTNATAYAYLGLLRPHLGLFNHPRDNNFATSINDDNDD
ncbi:MAG: hypothetical protein RIM23_23370 [Coleofasciculus sp. G3-WIS-01]|uniref:hypothetical protein n=1 Tax=Coleofasciculus sp. G3-WIS-01 TaxID=3069528 RepID=UPI0032F21C83